MKAKASVLAINDEEVVLNVIAGDGLYTDTVTVKAADNYQLFSEIAQGRAVHDVVDLEVEVAQVVTESLNIIRCST